MNIGEQIYYRRSQLKITQSQLAKGVCSISYLSKVENSVIEGNTDIIKILFDKLDLNYKKAAEFRVDIEKDLIAWYSSLIKEDINEAERLFHSLIRRVNEVSIVEQLYKFDLFRLRHELLKGNVEAAEELYVNLNLKLSNLSNENKYHYYHHVGLFFWMSNDYEKSLNYLQEALNQIPNNICHGEIYYHLSLVCFENFQISKSINFAQSAYSAYYDEVDVKGMIKSHLLIGDNFIKEKDYSLANKYLTKTLKTSSAMKETDLIGVIYHRLGLLEYKFNHLEKAIKYLNIGLESNIDNSLKVKIIYLLCIINIEKGNLEMGSDYLNWGLTVSLNENIEKYIILFRVIDIKYLGNNSNELITYLEDIALPYAKKNKKMDLICEFAEMASNVYENKNIYKKASELLKKANLTRKEYRI